MDYSTIKEFARNLRKNQTEAEWIIWNLVRNRELHGYKFTRQFVIEYKIDSPASHFFIVDFYCHEKKLIIEIDGEYHKYQLTADKEREDIIRAYGFRIIRFENNEVLNDIDNVTGKLFELLKNDRF